MDPAAPTGRGQPPEVCAQQGRLPRGRAVLRSQETRALRGALSRSSPRGRGGRGPGVALVTSALLRLNTRCCSGSPGLDVRFLPVPPRPLARGLWGRFGRSGSVLPSACGSGRLPGGTTGAETVGEGQEPCGPHWCLAKKDKSQSPSREVSCGGERRSGRQALFLGTSRV